MSWQGQVNRPGASAGSAKAAMGIAALVTLLLALIVISACDLGGNASNPNGPNGPNGPGSDQQPSKEPRDNTPVVLIAEQPAYSVIEDSQAIIDYSNAALGYIRAQSLTEGNYKVLLYSPDGSMYIYYLDEPYRYITIGLSCGDGEYQAGVYQHIRGDSYARVISVDFTVELEDPLKPFLYPNQYVEFEPDDEAVRLSQELTEGAMSEVEAIDAIYTWCVVNLSYDYGKAATVKPGYLPTNADTLESLDGICFDYAVLCASMLRAQRLPCKLEIGYYGDVYHAWITVYTTEDGVIRREIVFNPEAWTFLDPTIDSTQATVFGLGKPPTNYHDYLPMLFY